MPFDCSFVFFLSFFPPCPLPPPPCFLLDLFAISHPVGLLQVSSIIGFIIITPSYSQCPLAASPRRRWLSSRPSPRCLSFAVPSRFSFRAFQLHTLPPISAAGATMMCALRGAAGRRLLFLAAPALASKLDNVGRILVASFPLPSQARYPEQHALGLLQPGSGFVSSRNQASVPTLKHMPKADDISCPRALPYI
ncbi:hypothetical protein LX32DRAFT_364395 [Colletotrichum zoysiae]|uniref:Uncharacterized protein n=1 Tax=Colletotrichum zoysiae TaxID=1216348 RepID=A0AAD9HHS2_9PEZI|nr:hypothetical protein LX32DRAFT_364395 [Colletotrichum zoysiae]